MVFKTVIGLEIHVQLKTKSKMFCGCDNKAEEAAPNTLVCPVCMGMPGVLPVANRQAIEWTIKTGLALNCQIADFSRFDRKHYFYPDLPKNYQISQYDMPFATKGWLEISNLKSQISKIGIRRVHLEEDAGKLVHPAEADYSLVDFNRSGTPLMEVVTEPEISSPSEAKIFMQELRSILRYLDVSDADMEKGHLRCDANISVAKIRNPKSEIRNEELGTPVEIKNMNSFRMVERALAYEEKRQKELLEKGEKIEKETRGWDDAKGITYSQRGKEYAQDYRYFPEPDIPPFEPAAFDIEKLKSELPELPAAKRRRFVEEMKIPLQGAEILAIDRQMAEYFEKIAQKVSPKLAANWVINELKMDGILIVAPDDLSQLLENLENGKITGKMAKDFLANAITGEKIEYNALDALKAVILTDQQTEKIIEKVLRENPKPVEDFKKGKTQALTFLVGQVMRETRGRANPEVVNKILNEKIK